LKAAIFTADVHCNLLPVQSSSPAGSVVWHPKHQNGRGGGPRRAASRRGGGLDY
jgi:hypothetical protein